MSKLTLTKEGILKRDGFEIGEIKWFEDGKYSCYAFFPEQGMNFNLEEISLIQEKLKEVVKDKLGGQGK